MIGLIATPALPLASSIPVAALQEADRAYARLGEDFFKNAGWKCDASAEDRFLRVTLPLDGQEDPYGFLRTLGNMQAVLKDRARLVHIDQGPDGLGAHLGFPFPSLVVGLLTLLYGPQTMTPVFLSREVSRDEINRMYARNEQPVGLFDGPVFLGDLGAFVHAFLFMYHDLYHLVFGSALPSPLRRHWSALYDVVNGLPGPLNVLPIANRLLNCLTDNDVDASLAESPDLLAFVPFRAVMERIQEAHQSDNGEEALDIFKENRDFLVALVSALEATNDPVLIHRDFMMRQLRELNERVATQVAIREALEGLF